MCIAVRQARLVVKDVIAWLVAGKGIAMLAPTDECQLDAVTAPDALGSVVTLGDSCCCCAGECVKSNPTGPVQVWPYSVCRGRTPSKNPQGQLKGIALHRPTCMRDYHLKGKSKSSIL